MRIAHVTATFPPHHTGTGVVCYYNALGLARLGHEVTVYTADEGHGGYAYPAELGVEARVTFCGRVSDADLPAHYAAVALLLFLTGIVWFRRLERSFVDTIG